MDFSNPVMRTVRRARATGLAKPAARLISRSDSYEARFNASLTSSIRPGDRVWVIGANVGHYTAIFSSLAGPSGRVYAFEPTPSNFARLKLATGSLANVTAFQLALSDRQRAASFMQGTDDLGANSRVLAGRSGKLDGTGAIDIELTTGDRLLAERLVEAPSVIKIDVEGHELEVVRGLADQLASPNLRSIFIEVHFSLLDAANRSDVPGEIVRLLSDQGYKVDWLDPSHLRANKATA